MSCEYPTEETLEQIRTWSPLDTPGWLRFVASHWQYPERAFEDKAVAIFYLSTGGWSGNEDLIGAMQANHTAWSLCWIESNRWGRHLFLVKQ